MCCGEGQCCGPCCSLRSWFITHVVFVTLSVPTCLLISMLHALAIPAIINWTEQFKDSPEYQDLAETIDWHSFTEFSQATAALFGIMTVLEMIWCITGWYAICSNSEKGLKAYMVVNVVDAVFTIIVTIVSAVYQDKYMNEYSGMPMGVSPSAYIFIQSAFKLIIMNAVPLFCFWRCRGGMMSRHTQSDVVQLKETE